VSDEYKATIMVLVQHLSVSTAYCTSSTSYPSSEGKWKSCQIGMAIRNDDSSLYPQLGGQRTHLQAYASKCYTFTWHWCLGVQQAQTLNERSQPQSAV